MTTAIVHGDPGSRKTASLVSEYGVPALYQGRTVVSNIRGFSDLKLIEKVYGKPLPESAKLISVPFTREGFKRMGTFFHWAPPGALILMDEGQRIYPTRLRDLKYFDCKPARVTGFVDKDTGVAEDIETAEEAFDCHRHMNWDIYISTPNIEKVHKEIRQVAEYGYRQKDLRSILPILAFLLGDFKRVKHNAENKGIGEGQSISSTNHRVNKKAFQVYQSTATGVATNSHTKASILSQPKLLCLSLFILYSVYHFGDNYFTYGSLLPNSGQIAAMDSKHSSAGTTDQNVFESSVGPSEVFASPVAAATPGPVHQRRDYSSIGLELLPQLYSWSASIHNGVRTIHYFEVKTDTGIFTVTSDDLVKLGFEVAIVNSFAVVSHGDQKRIVTTVYRPAVEDNRTSSRSQEVVTEDI